MGGVGGVSGAKSREEARTDEPEASRSQAPPLRIVAAHSLGTREEVARARQAEEAFLARFGGRLAPPVKEEHQRFLDALRGREEELGFTERACNSARPTFVSGAALPPGARLSGFGADDLVAALRKKGPLTAEQEEQVRAAFERWRQNVCLQTGHDPTLLASAQRYEVAKVDTAARDAERAQKLVEIIDAIRQSPFAAAAFLDSAARGESLEGASERVRAAKAAGDVAMALPAARSACSAAPRRVPRGRRRCRRIGARCPGTSSSSGFATDWSRDTKITTTEGTNDEVSPGSGR